MTDAEKLIEAKDALHRLLVGERVVELVDQNGERVLYDRMSIPKLQAYIKMLERSTGQRSGAPLQVYF